jgi:hypothetical protein
MEPVVTYTLDLTKPELKLVYQALRVQQQDVWRRQSDDTAITEPEQTALETQDRNLNFILCKIEDVLP